jgi:prepilin-type N-terminal cleavage/methylation domain-containing protein
MLMSLRPLREGVVSLRRSQSGLTLVEVAIVLGIVAILGAIGITALNALDSALLAGGTKGASDQVVTAIRYTRQRAISEAQDYCIALRTAGGVGQYQIYTGGQSGGTTCTGPSVEGPVNLTGDATIVTRALRFTPVSAVDPVGPTSIVVTGMRNGVSCAVTLMVTPEGGVQVPGTVC